MAALYEYVRDQSGSPEVGRNFIQNVLHKCDLLADFPLIGRRRGELTPGLRGITFDRRVTVLYRVKPKSVEIVRVVYRGQDVDAAFR